MKNKTYHLTTLCLILTVLFGIVTACAPAPEDAVSSPIEITDQLGRVIKLDGTPQRIVSLAPSNTEILFALGLDDRIVAVTDFCDYPPQAKEKPSIGGFSTPNMEKLVALSPDLILTTSIHENIIPKFEERGMTVFTLSPKTLDEVLEAIALVGKITGTEKQASGLLMEMGSRVKEVTARTDILPENQRPAVFYVIWHDPLMTSGSGTLQDDLIIKAGGTNIARELTDYAGISLESVIAASPEVMIAGGGHGTGKDLTFRFVETETRLRGTDARRHNRVYMIDANLASRPGPRIVDALEMFAGFIHPELFK